MIYKNFIKLVFVNLIIMSLTFIIILVPSCKKIEKDKPQIDFFFSSDDFSVPSVVLFENKTTNATDYEWDFGDGTYSKEVNPSKTFTVEGTYSITLTAKGEGGTTSLKKQLVIKSKFSSFTDPRDGQSYKIVKIGNQWWFAQNLNYQTGNSWCYDNNPANCATFGRLYDWQTAMAACPNGWHIPSDSEWVQLITYLGGENLAGGKMKTITGWDAPNINATDSSGFSALPGGIINSNGFYGIGSVGYWWSSTENGNLFAWDIELRNNSENVTRYSFANKQDGFSVRCIKD